MSGRGGGAAPRTMNVSWVNLFENIADPIWKFSCHCPISAMIGQTKVWIEQWFKVQTYKCQSQPVLHVVVVWTPLSCIIYANVEKMWTRVLNIGVCIVDVVCMCTVTVVFLTWTTTQHTYQIEGLVCGGDDIQIVIYIYWHFVGISFNCVTFNIWGKWSIHQAVRLQDLKWSKKHIVWEGGCLRYMFTSLVTDR